MSLTIEYLREYRKQIMAQTNAMPEQRTEIVMCRDAWSEFKFWQSFHDMVDAIPKSRLHIPIKKSNR